MRKKFFTPKTTKSFVRIEILFYIYGKLKTIRFSWYTYLQPDMEARALLYSDWIHLQWASFYWTLMYRQKSINEQRWVVRLLMLKRASEINYNHLRVMITLISSHLDLGQRSILLQYVDAIRLNATSTEAVGLAYGLAGISIALMETATLLGDRN